MKTILKIMIPCLMLCGTMCSSCKKDEGVGTIGIAKVNVINAIVSGGKIKVQVGANAVAWNNISADNALGEDKGMGRLFMVPTNKTTLMKAVSLTDTTKVWYNQLAQLDAGKMYTLYLSGTPGNTKTSFQEELNFPKMILRDASRRTPTADSVMNVRFVNLSPSGPIVDINIQGKSTNEVSGLSYEAFSDFKVYPAKTDVDGIVFEIRKSSDKQLITSYYLGAYNFRFKSVAVVMKGVYSGTGLPYIDQYGVEAVAYQ